MTGLPPRLAEVLAEPPAAFSPAAIWWWSGEPLDRARLRRQLERFAAGGVYNLVVLNLAPSGPMFGSDADDPPFFSEAWWELFDGVCADAHELGIFLWFYDQLGFSGADVQARLVGEHPAYAGRWLERSGQVVRRGFDYLSRDACATLIDRVHGEFERRLPHWLGTVIAGSFQDELPALPTWSPEFAAEFEKRRGYDLVPHVAALWTGGDGDPAVRRDYHRTRAELAEEAFFRPLAEWHARHGLLHGCDQQDPARAGLPVDGVRLYADYARTHRWFGAPGSDHHGDARIHSSLAHLYDRPRTWIEAFHSTGWGGTLEETFDWLLPWLRSGATLYNPHAVYYTTKGGWWEWAPPATDWRQPYWPHHRVFADAVTRLCAALSLGRHVCDVAVLLPTATAQAGARLDGVDADAERAQLLYRELVGDMAWFRVVPGVLDRLRVDADVIDDDSVQRATVTGGRLTVASEAHTTIVLPGCTVLEAETARLLEEFAANGGRIVAVGALPARVVGGTYDLSRLRRAVRFVGTADALTLEHTGPLRVDAPVPALVREVGGATLVFLTAAFPRATDASVGRPDERGIELGWLDASYDFDPGRYATEMRVRVRGVQGRPLLAGPFGGTVRPLAARRDGDVTEVVVPFSDGPAALLIFDGSDHDVVERPSAAETRLDLGSTWDMELVATMDNTWGDFGPRDEPPGLARWEFRHRVEAAGDDGLRDGWAASAHDDAAWDTAHATFGPHALAAGLADDLPGPWPEAGTGWSPVVYSTSRGIFKDPIHREPLGPKGHVPEEFVDLGDVRVDQAVRLRTELRVPEAVDATLAVGAPAATTAWLDGVELPLDDHGHLATAPLHLDAGSHVLDLRLTPDETVRLRAHIALVRDPLRYRRPEWIAPAGPARPGAQVALSTTITVGDVPSNAMLQVAAVEPCRVLLNGVQVGRQGGFDPYAEHAAPRVRRYEVAAALRPGPNELTVELTERDTPAAVLADWAVGSRAEPWRATRDGEPVPVAPQRRQYGDPAALHLWRRPHPLPETAWLEGTDADDCVIPVVFAVPRPEAERVEWFRFAIPPGATRMTVPTCGETQVFVDGTEREIADDASVDLSDSGPGVRCGALRVRTRPGHEGGAALAAPVRFTVGPGRIELGDWETAGLAEYSGGVRYRRRIDLPEAAPVTLDLGRVRGTAEVTVNGHPAGTRVCSPYRFDLTDAVQPGENEIEILVYGTLAPYLDAVSPTHFVFPGQRVSGLFGPVHLLVRR
ncbi:glycosylhydrolase-like jelly roll fold domain-containing protein [Actinoallomurus iriomotensis]|uniref:Alpha-L-rhamnosidase-like protein n=1 Tax=Actinoallomurus iriomotensis TaxID=478107 RepID=A0A9W6VY23_9ACTN|nr:glycosylhydrolase-like jelly roll fold domain-containing protein [Actinoallomurus iriomotensis]GLY84440.1 hypothetical protein Airi02_023690 [Actinoallomurus iriomotensis]